MEASSVEEVFQDFKNRRNGMLKALTSDMEIFYKECDPAKDNLCLYGFPDKTWKVGLPADEVPPELPEPALGINFARDGMHQKDWLSLVAVHSDAWLVSVAFYNAARFGKQDRQSLYDMINGLPTLFEVLTGRANSARSGKDNNNNTTTTTNNNNNKSSSKKATSKVKESKKRPAPKKEEEEEYEEDEEEEEEEEEHGDTFCGGCGGPYNNTQFWIACDACEKWYHGTCVKMTQAKANQIGEYRCPACVKKARV